MIIINAQVKSRERVASHGEVFTAEREVKAMCDLVDDECRRFDSTFLEPACGDGNFLAEILSRKLSAISPTDERKSLIALSSLYGIDILPDNVISCRRRLFTIWESKAERSQAAKIQAARILQYNIVCGDTLKPETIDLMKWKFPEDGIVPDGDEFCLALAIYNNKQLQESEESGQLAFNFP